MKRIELIIGIFILVSFSMSCKKESPSDPADQFVGTYSYVLTTPEFGSQTDDLTITKTSSNTISILQNGGTPTSFTVDGINIKEDMNQVGNIPVTGGYAAFTENSTGILSDNTIAINGTWTNPEYETLTFKVIATKKTSTTPTQPVTHLNFDTTKVHLVLYYPFNESTGTSAKDESVDHNNGTISNCGRVTGKSGNALQFNFDGANVSTRPPFGKFSKGTVSVGAWINASELDPTKTYRIYGSYDYSELAIQIKNKKLEILWENTVYLTSTKEISLNTWQHIAFTSDGSTIRIFINGIEDVNKSIIFPFALRVGPMYIGVHHIYTGNSGSLMADIDQFKGMIDEFKVWNMALSASQISAEYEKLE